MILLVHSMGRGAGGEFAERDRVAARCFARMAREERIRRIVRLGGRGDGEGSAPLQADPSPAARFGIDALPFDETLRRALDEADAARARLAR